MRLRRGTPLSVVSAVWRVAPEALQEALEHDLVPAVVGPTGGGWAAARVLVEGESVLEARRREVADLVDDLARSLRAPGVACLPGESGSRLLVACPGGGLPVAAEVPALGAADRPARADWSELLRVLDRLEVLGEVLEAADPGPPRTPSVAELTADRRALDVAALLGLPAVLVDLDVLDAEQPWREAVVARDLPAADVALAAASTGGPLLLASVPGTASAASPEPDGVALLPAALQLAPLRRPVLLLWRRGDARGALLVRKARVEEAHTWSAAWRVVALDPAYDAETREGLTGALLPPEADAAVLAERLGGPETDVVALRTLLRRPPGPDCLAALCAALDLDPAAAHLVESGDPLPGARPLAPAQGVGAIWDAATAPRAGDPWYLTMSQRKPWWYRLADVAFAVVAVLWALALWDGGGLGARVGAVVLVLLALGSVVDAVTPGWGRRASRL